MIVEDGSGLANADSLLSINEALSILSDLVPSATFPDLDQSLQESCLKAASLQLDTFYGFGGSIFSLTQAFKCPRQDLYDSDGRLLQGVPRLLKYAVAIQAEYLATSDWREDLSSDIKKASIGPIVVEMVDKGSTGAKGKSPITLGAAQFMKSIATPIIKTGRRGSTRLVSV